MIHPIDRTPRVHPGRLAIKARPAKTGRSLQKLPPSVGPSSLDILLDDEPRDLFEAREVDRYMAAHWRGGDAW